MRLTEGITYITEDNFEFILLSKDKDSNISTNMNLSFGSRAHLYEVTFKYLGGKPLQGTILKVTSGRDEPTYVFDDGIAYSGVIMGRIEANDKNSDPHGGGRRTRKRKNTRR